MTDQKAPPPLPPQGRLVWRLFKRSLPLLIVLGGVAGVAAIVQMPASNDNRGASEAAPLNVEVLTVRAVPSLDDTFTLAGQVEPSRVVTISSEVAGRIEKIHKRPGETVKEDDLLIELNKDSYQAELDHARAMRDFSKDRLRKLRDLQDKSPAAGDRLSPVTQNEIDEAVRDYNANEALVGQATARFNRCTIYARSSGYLNRLVLPGLTDAEAQPEVSKVLAQYTPVAQIVTMNPAKVMIDVPEREMRFVRLGTDVKVTDPQGDASLGGRITYIAKLANPSSRTTRVEIEVPNSDEPLRSGQIVSVCITRRKIENAIMVPLLAVIPDENGYCVYVVEDSEGQTVARQRAIRLSGDDTAASTFYIKNNYVRVLDGLRENEKLIYQNHRLVASGQKVKVVKTVDEVASVGPVCSTTASGPATAASQAATAIP